MPTLVPAWHLLRCRHWRGGAGCCCGVDSGSIACDVQMRRSAQRLLHAAPQLPLVAGGAGQLGRHLLRALAEAGSPTVRVLDARPPVAPPDGLAVEFARHRLGRDDATSLERALDGVDCVFSLITPDVQHASIKDFTRTNVDGVRNLLRASRAAGAQRFVHVSSVAVTELFTPSIDQNEEKELPSLDEYTLAYDRTKRLGEDAVLSGNTDGFATVSLRPGAILNGPRGFTLRSAFEREGNVVSLEGSALMDYIAAEDLCSAALLAAERLDSPSVAGQAFYVTKGETIRPEDVAQLVAKEMGWQLTLLPPVAQTCIGFGLQVGHAVKSSLGWPVPGVAPHDYLRIASIQKTFDNSRAMHVLNYCSKVSVEEAVSRAVAEYRQSRR